MPDYYEKRKSEEETYQKDMELFHMNENEEPEENNGGIGAVLIWLVAAGVVVYAIMSMVGKI